MNLLHFAKNRKCVSRKKLFYFKNKLIYIPKKIEKEKQNLIQVLFKFQTDPHGKNECH